MEQAFLQIVSGMRRGLNVPLSADRALVVGRKRGDLILDDPLVSGSQSSPALWLRKTLNLASVTMRMPPPTSSPVALSSGIT